jgi:hypothetical protein
MSEGMRVSWSPEADRGGCIGPIIRSERLARKGRFSHDIGSIFCRAQSRFN